jgi:acrylyl-CoA reductase (NADPH)
MSAFRALQTSKTDNGYQTSLVERSTDELPAGDVLIRVEYSSLNYKDALSASGNKGVTREYPHTPGIDAAGEVVEASAGPLRPGDKVIVTGFDLGMNTAGGYGEYIRVPAEWVVDMPEGLDTRTAMLYGTAGLTAALCVESLLDTGIQPGEHPVLVTGATGGVGSMAVAILSKLGVHVVAGTGKADAHDWLRELGAAEIISRDELLAGVEKPLLKPRWGGVVDCVGGDILVNALKSLQYGASAVCCGLAGSPEMHGTVLPFILRNVNLLGVDSVEIPVELKQQMWQLLAKEWRPERLDLLLNEEVDLEALIPWFDRILKGGARGRVLVKVSP